MKISGLWTLWPLLGVVLPLIAQGQGVYRTLDKEGQVIFTDVPPTDQPAVEVMELPPGPSEAERQKAESRLEAMRQKLEENRRQREARTKEKKAEADELKQQLAEAEARLREARILKDEDRQTLAGRGRRIRPEYFQRIEEAEAEVEAIRKRLNQVRSGR